MINHIAHIVNVAEITEANKNSYLHIAQPVTLQSMLVAQRAAAKYAQVDLFAIKNKGEQVEVPQGFSWAKDIEKYAWEYIPELAAIQPRKPFPRLADIIQGLYAASEAEYFIYSNVDIGVFPDFYIFVNNMIEKGIDACCINRRTLPKEFQGQLIDESNYQLCYLLEGELHWGIDCFVFKRAIVPMMKLNDVFVGAPPVGSVMKTQIEQNSKNFRWIKYARVTFHLGNDKVWRVSTNPYWIKNEEQAKGLYMRPSPKGSTSKLDRFWFRTVRRINNLWKKTFFAK